MHFTSLSPYHRAGGSAGNPGLGNALDEVSCPTFRTLRTRYRANDPVGFVEGELLHLMQ
jgi:hypothetical protein